MRDFAFVRLPHYLRAVAILLIFASPVLATLYFAPTLDHFNKALYHIPSFVLLALSAIIFCRLRKYLDYDRMSREVSGELHWQDLLELPRASSSQSCCRVLASFFSQSLYEQTALQKTQRVLQPTSRSNSRPSSSLRSMFKTARGSASPCRRRVVAA